MFQSQSSPPYLPVVFQSPGPQVQSVPVNETPARIRVALEFLMNLTVKTMPRAAVNDMSIEWAELAELSLQERSAQGAACEMLRKYFSGELNPDSRETAEADLKSKIMDRGLPTDRPGIRIICFACVEGLNRQPKATCKFCRGSGEVLVFPSNDGVQS